MYNDTITLFNKVSTPTGDIWYGTVLKGVDLITDRASIIAKYGESGQDSAKLHVKYQYDAGEMVVGGKSYIAEKYWQKVGYHSDYITFQPTKDFFVKGAWELPIVNDNDYPKGFFDYMKRNEEAFLISSVGGPYDLIQHFEIMAK